MNPQLFTIKSPPQYAEHPELAGIEWSVVFAVKYATLGGNPLSFFGTSISIDSFVDQGELDFVRGVKPGEDYPLACRKWETRLEWAGAPKDTVQFWNPVSYYQITRDQVNRVLYNTGKSLPELLRVAGIPKSWSDPWMPEKWR